jgi:hypothetical protein
MKRLFFDYKVRAWFDAMAAAQFLAIVSTRNISASALVPDAGAFTVGGTVQAGRGIYIPRAADEELLGLCRAGSFAYVLSPRQKGKSSLMRHTAEQLAAEGIRSAMIDLSGLGVQLTAEAWYLGLLTSIEEELELCTDVIDWWDSNARLGSAQRLTRFFREVLLAELDARVVIFVDEIDTTLSLSFTDDFYAEIRYLYNTRALAPELSRLSFVLMGVATPGDLISDAQRTPFNIGRRVELTDFSFDEALPLGLAESHNVLRWVLRWTGGHPYLTQRLCRSIVESRRDSWTESDVDEMVQTTFLGAGSEQDNNLLFVRDMLTKRAPDRLGVLSTYLEIRRGRNPVKDEEQSVVKNHLKLSGIVLSKGELLQVSNRIYAEVFNLEWIAKHLPTNWDRVWRRALIGGGALFIVVLIGFLAFAWWSATVIAEQQQQLADQEVAAAANANQLYKLALSRQLSLQSVNRLRDQLDLGLLLSVQAYRTDDTADARGALLGALEFSPSLVPILSGHTDSVLNLAFGPDGKLLASASADGTVRLWDVASQRPFGTPLTGHTSFVYSVAFRPDGKLLASASADGTVRLWDVASQQPLGTPLTGLTSPTRGVPVLSLAFSPDGKLLASGSLDRTVRLWDVSDPQAATATGQPLTGHTNAVLSMAFSPDGKLLASASDDRTARLWDVTSQQPLGTPLTGHTGPVNSVAFSPDGKTLASASADKTVRLWDVASQQPLGAPLTGHTDSVNGVAFSPDGTTLASASADRSLLLWDVSLDSWVKSLCRLPKRNMTLAEWTNAMGERAVSKHVPQRAN